jgi:light-regulated signal transduction histidine kinase (bacteriophytochrome)
MKLLTDDISAYFGLNKAGTGKVWTSVHELINKIKVQVQQKHEDVLLILEQEALPSLHVFPALAELLLFHLLDNAVKYRRHDTDCQMKISYAQAVRKEGSYHVISFGDCGSGFEPEHAEHIFSFFTRVGDKNKYPGSGIGLAVCRKIMELHDGFITAESTPGEGATFHCFFPVLAE